MPKLARYTLTWNAKIVRYELHEQGGEARPLPPDVAIWWLDWLSTHTSFAFYGRQGRMTLLKEPRARGDEYWYAYRTHNRHTSKRYAGRAADLSMEHLEEIAGILADAEKSTRPAALQQQRNNATAAFPLLEPKFRTPHIPAMLVKRARLFEKLDTGLERRLTLLCAPAGFGKTTLAGQWLNERKTQDQFPAVAWVSLESEDSDPIRFWRYVITACQQFHPDLGRSSLEQISLALQPPFTLSSLETALTQFLNDLTRLPSSGLLILEDYHFISEPRIHASMAFLLDHLPAHFHIILLTRSEPPLPLARWRARGELAELSAADLRFSRAEMEHFLRQNTALQPENISEEALNQLDRRLEGWAVGLRLLVLALQGGARLQGMEQVLATFAGDQRLLQDYFVSEVLHAQPEELQDFLLCTSILTRLTAALCNAITGQSDSEQLLADVERAGLFLEALDGVKNWHRYHALFAEAMRAEALRRLGPESISTLLRRASQWYEQQGMFAEAVEAALQARDTELAVALIEQILARTGHFILNPQAFLITQGFHTLRRWLEQLPEALVHQRPLLCLGYASSLLLVSVGEQFQPSPVAPADISVLMAKIEEMLRLAERGFRLVNDTQGLGAVFAFCALLTRERGETSQAVSYAERALTCLAEDDLGWRSTAFNVIGMGRLLDGELAEARKIFLNLCAICERFGNRAIMRANSALLNVVNFEQGELRQSAAFFRRMLAEAREEGDLDDIAHALFLLALFAYERNELQAAEQQATEVLSLSQRLGNEEFQTQATLILARIERARGQTGNALQRCSDLLASLPANTPLRHRLSREVQLELARFYLASGDSIDAQRRISGYEEQTKALPLVLQWRETLLVARCQLAQGRATEALEALAPVLEEARRKGCIRRALEMQTFMVLIRSALGEAREARELLQDLLAQAQGEGHLRLFLDEGQAMLSLLRSITPQLRERRLVAYAQTILRAEATNENEASLPTQALLAEPLSGQEQRVLHLLVTGHSNPEIARELIISVNTVKAHVQNVYRKLNVNNRVEASEVARLLQLVGK